MEYRRLGRSALSVSALGLGTMTWGRQNTEAEAHAQMDYALEQGVNFWDTAEMYAVPSTAETYGRTEEIIGSWLRREGGRDRIVLASKVIGKTDGGLAWIRGGQARLDRANIVAALDDSLRRLNTDYLDLYQLHWPDRATNRFGQRDYHHRPDEDGVPLAESLAVLADLVQEGKIRQIGLSNETAWGVMSALALSEHTGVPRIASLQNPYNLLNRAFETDLSEIVLREDVGLIVYAPLGAGTLSGKYLDGAIPPGSRRSLETRATRYHTVNADAATRAYLDVARQHGLIPTQMAIAFVRQQPFVASVLIGATSLEQLRSNLAAATLTLSAAALDDIAAVHERYPTPCP